MKFSFLLSQLLFMSNLRPIIRSRVIKVYPLFFYTSIVILILLGGCFFHFGIFFLIYGVLKSCSFSLEWPWHPCCKNNQLAMDCSKPLFLFQLSTHLCLCWDHNNVCSFEGKELQMCSFAIMFWLFGVLCSSPGVGESGLPIPKKEASLIWKGIM